MSTQLEVISELRTERYRLKRLLRRGYNNAKRNRVHALDVLEAALAQLDKKMKVRSRK